MCQDLRRRPLVLDELSLSLVLTPIDHPIIAIPNFDPQPDSTDTLHLMNQGNCKTTIDEVPIETSADVRLKLPWYPLDMSTLDFENGHRHI